MTSLKYMRIPLRMTSFYVLMASKGSCNYGTTSVNNMFFLRSFLRNSLSSATLFNLSQPLSHPLFLCFVFFFFLFLLNQFLSTFCRGCSCFIFCFVCLVGWLVGWLDQNNCNFSQHTPLLDQNVRCDLLQQNQGLEQSVARTRARTDRTGN